MLVGTSDTLHREAEHGEIDGENEGQQKDKADRMDPAVTLRGQSSCVNNEFYRPLTLQNSVTGMPAYALARIH